VGGLPVRHDKLAGYTLAADSYPIAGGILAPAGANHKTEGHEVYHENTNRTTDV
jgi:hypothetical protein